MSVCTYLWWEEIVLQYGDSVRSFPRIVFSLVKQKVSGEQLVAMEFTDQVSTFVELKLGIGR